MDIKALLRDWRFQLSIVTLIAILIRSIPAWIYSAWGNDFGVYYSITIEFFEKRNPFYEYPAVWGSSGYGSFPMLYTIILIAHILTGLSPQELLLKVPPIIGGLTVIPLYFISYELTKRRGTSLLAATLLAINPIHVYQTSMPYFLTIGHFFMLCSMYFFIKWQRDRKYIFYLVPFSIALLLSHHLTTYMFIISITGISMFLGLFSRVDKAKTIGNFIFIAFYSGTVFSYWLLRVPGMIGFMEAPFHFLIPWYVEIMLFFVGIAALLIFSLKVNLHRSRKIENFLNSIKIRYFFAVSLSLGILFLIFLAVVGLKGYDIPFVSIIYSIPFMLTIGFIGVGLSRLYKNDRVLFVLGGWIAALTFSLVVAVITWKSLEPWRHIEYLMEPLSIVAALGIREVLRVDAFKKISIKKRIKVTLEAPFYIMMHHLPQELGAHAMIPKPSSKPVREPIDYEIVVPLGKNMQILFSSVIIFIVLMTAVMAFPFMNEIEHPRVQGISPVAMSGVQWLIEFGNRNYTVATDHKMGTLLAAHGFNSSFEYDYKIWNATDWKECLWELAGLNGTYPIIGYVLISADMYNIGVYGYNESQNPLQPPVIMSPESYAKFKQEPFELIFRNATEDDSDWVEIYRVNWTYISSNVNISKYLNISYASKNIGKGYTPWYSHRDFLNFSISCSREFNRSLLTSMPAIFIMNSRDFR